MSQPLPSSTPNRESARDGDGLLVILQNNADRTLRIHRMNPAAASMLGFAEGNTSAIGQPIETILGKSTAELLAEEIEFSDDAPDFGEVISRQRELRLRTTKGKEFIVTPTVNRLMSEGMNACFQLILPDAQEALAEERIRNFLALNLEGHKQTDAVTGLPDHATAEAFMPLLANYLAESGMQVAFAVLRLDRHAKSIARYGAEECTKLLQHTAKCCIGSFRSEDIVFALSDHTLGLVLFDISRESARLVLNRLRWNIRSHQIMFGNKPDFTVTTSVGFDMVTGEGGRHVLGRCESLMQAFDPDMRNALVELSV